MQKTIVKHIFTQLFIVLIVVAIFCLLFYIGLYIGYVKVGHGESEAILKFETWERLYQLIR